MTTITSHTAEMTMSPVAGTRWTLDPAHTSVDFAVRHLMISTVRGRFGKFSGRLGVDDAHPSIVDVNVEIEVASVDTSEEKRDAHLRSADFFDAERFPAIRFTGGRVQGDVNGTFKLYGDLTIRDVTKPVTLTVEHLGRMKDPWGAEKQGFSASTILNRQDFGLRWNVALEAGGVLVADDVKVTIEAQFGRDNA